MNVDNIGNMQYHRSVEKEIKSHSRIKVYDDVLLACQMNLTPALVLSALIDIKSANPYQDEARASLSDLRSILASTFSKQTISNSLNFLEDMRLITREVRSGGRDKTAFFIHYSEILNKSEAYKHTT